MNQLKKRGNLNETEGYDNDNGDAEHDAATELQNYLLDGEDKYGPITTKQIIRRAIELYPKVDIHAARLAGAVDFILKNRY